MKKIFILSTVISFAMICSCQKQDAAAEQQLAQRKVELDAREDALDERMNALDERVNALDERVKALAENEKADVERRERFLPTFSRRDFRPRTGSKLKQTRQYNSFPPRCGPGFADPRS